MVRSTSEVEMQAGMDTPSRLRHHIPYRLTPEHGSPSSIVGNQFTRPAVCNRTLTIRRDCHMIPSVDKRHA